MKILHCLAVFILFSGGLLAGTIDPSVQDQKYIEYAEGFPFVGQYIGVGPNSQPIIGSVVAHMDDIVLTAAHVVENSSSSFIHINGNLIKVKKHIVHEKYRTNVYGYFDIAIAILEKKIGLEWYPDLYERKDEVSQICSLSGFGKTGTFHTGAIILDSKQRAGSNRIDSIDRGLLVCTPSVSGRTALEFLIASGDSGGGLFINNRIAGIHSCVMGMGKLSNSEYGSESGHTRISDHTQWIRDNIHILKAIPHEKK
jgi:hypothetical protein